MTLSPDAPRSKLFELLRHENLSRETSDLIARKSLNEVPQATALDWQKRALLSWPKPVLRQPR